MHNVAVCAWEKNLLKFKHKVYSKRSYFLLSVGTVSGLPQSFQVHNKYEGQGRLSCHSIVLSPCPRDAVSQI